MTTIREVERTGGLELKVCWHKGGVDFMVHPIGLVPHPGRVFHLPGWLDGHKTQPVRAGGPQGGKMAIYVVVERYPSSGRVSNVLVVGENHQYVEYTAPNGVVTCEILGPFSEEQAEKVAEEYRAEA